MCYSSITWEPESLFILRSLFIPGSGLGKIILIGSSGSTFCSSTGNSKGFYLSSTFGERAGTCLDPSALIHFLDEFLLGDSKVLFFTNGF